jgi:hypothetical protein
MRATEAGEDSPKMIWAGRILTVLTALFMLLDGVMKIVKPPQVLQANVGRSPATFVRAPGGSRRSSPCSSPPWFEAAWCCEIAGCGHYYSAE